MSTFIHSPAHVIAIVASAARLNLGSFMFRRSFYDLANPVDCDALCRRFYAANVRSVNSRYNERTRLAMPDRYDEGASRMSAAALCKAIDSLNHQSCERSDWAKSTACRILGALRQRASNMAVGKYKAPATMPDYDKVSTTDAYQMADVWAIN